VLSFTAGFVDIVGSLSIYSLFTAHMTGTTVHMGQHFVSREWKPAFAAAIIVGSFFVASLAGRALIESGERAGFRRIASITFLLEAVLLFCVVAIGRNGSRVPHELEPMGLVCALLGLLAAAMGLQTATVTKIGPLTVHTTFVTGMLNKLAQVVSLWAFAVYDLRFRKHRSSEVDLRNEASENARKARFLSAIWFLYLAGAGCGTWLDKLVQLNALYLPCGILLAVIAVDRARPLSIEEEQEQAE
jgi:uncharacterized membrane protein YoaK (UPF0700 family)